MLRRLFSGLGCIIVVGIGGCMLVAAVAPKSPPTATPASGGQSLMIASPSNTSAPESTTAPTSTASPTPLPSATSTDEPDEEESDDPNYNAVMARYKQVKGVVSVDGLNVIMTKPGVFYVYVELIVQAGYNTEKMATVMRAEAAKALGKTPADCTIIIFDGKVAKDYAWRGDTLNITTLSITPIPKDTQIPKPTATVKRIIATATRRPIATRRPTATRRPPTEVPIIQPTTPPIAQQQPAVQPKTCPRNCDEAKKMGLSPQEAAACGLDRDHDGVACYGD